LYIAPLYPVAGDFSSGPCRGPLIFMEPEAARLAVRSRSSWNLFPAAIVFPSMRATRTLYAAPMVAAAALGLLAGCRTPAGQAVIGRTGDGSELTVVYSRAQKGYARAQRPDGSFVPETYVLKDGGNFGGPRVDRTIDAVNFDQVSLVIGRALAEQDYVESGEDAPSLLIMVFWGTTIVPNDVMPPGTRPSDTIREEAANIASGRLSFATRQKSMADAEAATSGEGRIVGRIDAQSANILGYTDEIFRTSPRDPYMKTLQDEVESDRYCVVLLAYDYTAARRFGVHRLLWETRFSIPETGFDFERAFPSMAAIAGKYFGQDSHGLVHHRLGDGRVDLGETKSLGTVPEK
jgi:hypothetical protein